jgi:hypothetical protein
MTVIAFRPRAAPDTTPTLPDHPGVRGTVRSPRGRAGRMIGSVRVQRLVLVPRGAFVTGVFTGELRDDDGSLVAIGSRRATAAADLIEDDRGFRPWVRPFSLDLTGITVEVAGFAVDPALAFPRLDPGTRRPVVVLRPENLGPVS